MRPRLLLIAAVVLSVCAGSLFEVAHARVKSTEKVPARIHFSGNFEGELEPCG
jgi:hypothetical protein